MTPPPPSTPEPNPHQTCDLEMLALFSVGELDAAQRETVSAHLLDCDRCWNELRAQRLVIGAVQQLWEPAPTGLRADIHAAIAAAPQPRSAPGIPRRRMVLLAAALVAAIIGGSVVAVRISSAPDRPQVAATSAIPAAVQAAITQADGTPPADSSVPTAPTLSRMGLRLAASGSTKAADIPTAQYTYADSTGHRLTVFVAARAWPRPARADTINSTAWIITPTALTVVGGPDQAGDAMLIIASDHTAAMTAAAALGLI